MAEQNTTDITARVPASLKDKLNAAAAAERRPLSQLVRIILEEHFEREAARIAE